MEDHFISTQIQSAYETSEQIRQEKTNTSGFISQLQKFSQKSEVSTKPVTKSVIKKAAPKRKTKRIKSITSHVEKLYGSNADISSQQKSILTYFSGKKGKIKDILQRLEKGDKDASRLGHLEGNIPYNKEEWAEIIDSITQNFPGLSESTNRTLKSITSRIEKETANDGSLWSQASKQPSFTMTPENIQYLYDLNSSQMVGSTTDVEEIPDSCSEPEILRLPSITSHQPEHMERSEQVNVLDSMSSLRFKVPDVIEVPSAEKNENADIEIISSDEVMSSVRSTPSKFSANNSPFKSFTPQVRNFSSRINSPLASPTKRSLQSNPQTPQRKTQSVVISPTQYSESEFVDAESDSGYATAASQLPRSKYSKRYVMVGGDFIKDVDTLKVKIRKVFEERNETNDEEVIDSEYEDNQISIIELSTLVEEDERDSVIQVPTSPLLSEDVLSPQSEPLDDSQYGNTEATQMKNNLELLNKMSAKELKAILTEWGLKPLRSKEKMVDLIQRTSQIVGSQDPSQMSQSEFNDKLFEKISNYIRSSPEWKQKINSYEPILISELKQWLDSQQVYCELLLLENYCDAKGICFTAKWND